PTLFRSYQLIVQYLRILFTRNILIALAPFAPAMCHTMCHLLNTGLPSQRAIRLRNTSLSKIFLSKNICSNLAPVFWNFHIIQLKNDLTARVFNNRSAVVILKHIERIHAFLGEFSGEYKAFESGI